jgi:hypothetical protein
MTPIYKDGKTIQAQPRKRLYVTLPADMDCGGKARRVLVVWHKRQPGMWCRWTQTCTGCTDSEDGQVLSGPFGCKECGYTTKRRVCVWVPLPLEAHKQAIAKNERDRSRSKTLVECEQSCTCGNAGSAVATVQHKRRSHGATHTGRR